MKLDVQDHWFMFPFEKTFRPDEWLVAYQNNWMKAIPLSAVYVLAIFSGQYIMRDKKPFKLRAQLIAWNCILAGISILTFVRLSSDTLDSVFSHGIYESVCIGRNISDHVFSFWSAVFGLLKIPELLDTAFIILRKRKLIFLHWYHHITVLIYTVYSIQDLASTGRWFMWMNSFVHSLMYSYYALRAMNVKLPKIVSMTLTFLQISQMFVGCTINYLVYKYSSAGLFCGVSRTNFIASLLMYFSYFLLFLKYFYETYFRQDPVGKGKVN